VASLDDTSTSFVVGVVIATLYSFFAVNTADPSVALWSSDQARAADSSMLVATRVEFEPTETGVAVFAAATIVNVTLELNAALVVPERVIFIVPLEGAVTLTATAASSAAVASASVNIVADLPSGATITFVILAVPVMDVIVPAVSVQVNVVLLAGISAAADAVVPHRYLKVITFDFTA
jgi:hypothetical protein